MKNLLTALIPMILLLVLTSCETKLPASDDTPPVIQMYLIPYEGSENIIPIQQDTMIMVSPNSRFYIHAQAHDPEGLRTLQMHHNYKVFCNNSNGESDDLLEDESNLIANINPGVGNLVPTSGSLSSYVFGMKYYVCRGGYSFTGATGQIHAFAYNFYNGRSRSVTVTLKPTGLGK